MRNKTNDFKHIKERTSASQLKLFTSCPLAFKYKYIFGYKPKYSAHIDAIFYAGSKLHEAIHSSYLFYPSEDELASSLKTWLSLNWDQRRVPVELFLQTLACVTNFTGFELLRRKHYDYKPESELKMQRDGYYGILDFYDQAMQCIIDFKTGTSAKITSDNKTQAAVYDILAEGNGQVSFYYLYTNTIKTYKVEEKVRDNVYKTKEKILHALETDTFPTANHCRFCPFSYCCNRKHRA